MSLLSPGIVHTVPQLKGTKSNGGSLEGEEVIAETIKATYSNILDWKKNIFALPRGKNGSAFIKELSRLLNLFNNKTKWEGVAISMVHIFLPIMLQKPSAKSKARDNAKYLGSRLERWRNGEIASLLAETNETQKRMKKSLMRKEESREKAFVRLMMFGKIGQAAKFINNEDSVKGVHSLSEEIKDICTVTRAGYRTDP